MIVQDAQRPTCKTCGAPASHADSIAVVVARARALLKYVRDQFSSTQMTEAVDGISQEMRYLELIARGGDQSNAFPTVLTNGHTVTRPNLDRILKRIGQGLAALETGYGSRSLEGEQIVVRVDGGAYDGARLAIAQAMDWLTEIADPAAQQKAGGAREAFVPLDPETQEHDMKIGPCKCGAWHND